MRSPFVAAIIVASSFGTAAAATLPQIGCASDGQVEPTPAPVSSSTHMNLAAQKAARLALYVSPEGMKALAPRGWKCLGLEGSNGSMLFIAPEAVAPDVFFKGKWPGFSGPAVTMMWRSGDTSGRFEVAAIAARIFHKQQKFVKRVIAEGTEPASHFPTKPYPHDRLTYDGDRSVDFTTAPGAKGLGTNVWLIPNTCRSSGTVRLVDDTPNLALIDVRLCQRDADLEPFVMNHFKQENPLQ